MQAQHRPLLRRGGRSFFLDIPSYRTSPLIGLIGRFRGVLSPTRKSSFPTAASPTKCWKNRGFEQVLPELIEMLTFRAPRWLPVLPLVEDLKVVMFYGCLCRSLSQGTVFNAPFNRTIAL